MDLLWNTRRKAFISECLPQTSLSAGDRVGGFLPAKRTWVGMNSHFPAVCMLTFSRTVAFVSSLSTGLLQSAARSLLSVSLLTGLARQNRFCLFLKMATQDRVFKTRPAQVAAARLRMLKISIFFT